jgi:hypothetical protein
MEPMVHIPPMTRDNGALRTRGGGPLWLGWRWCCREAIEVCMIDGLRCYGGMYLYMLGGLWLHDRSNLVLIYYNHILSFRNSNKLETKFVT